MDSGGCPCGHTGLEGGDGQGLMEWLLVWDGWHDRVLEKCTGSYEDSMHQAGWLWDCMCFWEEAPGLLCVHQFPKASLEIHLAKIISIYLMWPKGLQRKAWQEEV